MTYDMTYATTDWEAEARRVGRAFGLKGPCEFYESETDELKCQRCFSHFDSWERQKKSGHEIYVTYDAEKRCYTIVHPTIEVTDNKEKTDAMKAARKARYDRNGKSVIDDSGWFAYQQKKRQELQARHPKRCTLEISWDGELLRQRSGGLGWGIKKVVDEKYAEVFARALLCLDLLTPEIEAALNVEISAHQKAEWLVEFDERMKVEL